MLFVFVLFIYFAPHVPMFVFPGGSAEQQFSYTGFSPYE
jgi:hypothetical protein